MKKFNLNSFLLGLVVGIVIGAGAMSLSGGTADNSDLQGAFSSVVPTAEEFSAVSGPGTVPGAATTCTDDECDIMDLLEKLMEDGSGATSWTLEGQTRVLSNWMSHYADQVIDDITGPSSWTLYDLAANQYNHSVLTSNFTTSQVSGASSWTLEALAEQMYNVCN